ncbi:MAG: caspase family protein, partial [Cyanobacteria bacterium J06555_13]
MKHYALVVGIGDYDQSIIPSLSKPKTDAEAVWDTLQESGLYQDVALLNRHVTRSVLQASLETLLLKRGKQSNVLLYFTGHGFTAGEDEYDTQGYLATQDCEVQVVNQKVKTVRNGFSFLSLNGIIEQAELSSLVVFLDCCYSGFFVEKNQIRKNFSVFGRSNYFLVTACRSFEEAYAWKSAEHSIFSSALLKALRENSSQITAFEVFQRIERELKGSGQEPLYIGAGGDISLLRRQQVVFPSEVKEECPYRGLEPFTPETSEFFFGRDYEVGLLRQKLENFNFVMLLGSSGSGKSSVVKAGLVPYLRKNEWQVMTMTPGDNPISVLRLQLKNYMDLQQILESRQRDLLLIFDQKGLPAFAESVASEIPTHKRMLLVIDQFEEVFTQCDVDKQKKFIRSLLALLKIPSPIFVVGTMRADFFHHWLETGQPTSVIQENAVILGPLLGDNLVSVIVEPAKKQGYRLEEGLLRLLLQDVEEEKDSLPLLEFTLTELWHGRDIDERQLTVKTYEKISGLQGALNKRAMSIYDGLQSDEYRVWMKRICLQLVRIGRAGYDTRQRQPISLLLDMAGKDNQSQQKILDVIAKMISGRLLVSGNNWHPNIEHESEDDKDRKEERFAYLDIAHEALLEGWQKFKEWRQENRDQRRLVQRLEDAYAEWKKKGERKEYLLTGGLLLEISEQWDDIRHIPKGKRRSILTEFFLFSKEHKRSEISGSTQDFTRSRLKEAADQTRAKLRLAPAKSVDAAIKAIELTEQSQTNLDNQEITGPIQSLLYSVFCSVWEKIKIEAHDDWITAIAFSPQDDVVVSASFDRSLRLWDLDGNPLGPRFSGHTDWVTSAVFSADGQLIISGSSDGTIRLWNLDGEAVGQP